MSNTSEERSLGKTWGTRTCEIILDKISFSSLSHTSLRLDKAEVPLPRPNVAVLIDAVETIEDAAAAADVEY